MLRPMSLTFSLQHSPLYIRIVVVTYYLELFCYKFAYYLKRTELILMSRKTAYSLAL